MSTDPRPKRQKKTARRSQNIVGNTLNKHIRVDENHWGRIEAAANQRGVSPSRLLIECTLQAIEDKQWPGTEAEIRMYRSCLFTAQVLARDFVASDREEELEQIRRDVSKLAPELPKNTMEPSSMEIRLPYKPQDKE